MYFIFMQTVKTSQELRKPVYYGIASKAIAYDQVLQQYKRSLASMYFVLFFSGSSSDEWCEVGCQGNYVATQLLCGCTLAGKNYLYFIC